MKVTGAKFFRNKTYKSSLPCHKKGENVSSGECSQEQKFPRSLIPCENTEEQKAVIPIEVP